MRLIVLGIANHAVLAGSRVTVSLAALDKGATPLTIGVLMALYALLPMLFAVAAGRFSDRAGVRRPMLLGTAAIAVGASLPIAAPGLPMLFASAVGDRHRFHGIPGGDAERDRRTRAAVGARPELQHAGARILHFGLRRPSGRGIRDRPPGICVDVRAARDGALRPARRPAEPPARAAGAAPARRARAPRRRPRAAAPSDAAAPARDQCAVRRRLGPAHGLRPDLRRAHRALGFGNRSRPLDVRRRHVRRAPADAGESRDGWPSSRC